MQVNDNQINILLTFARFTSMTFLQKIKIILQVLFIGGLFLLNAAVYQKYNYFAQARHLSYIPKSSVLAVTINANRLTGKFLYQFVYKNEEILELLEEAELDQQKDQGLLQSGIDLTTQLSFVMTHTSGKTHGRHDYAILLFDVSSTDNATHRLGKMGFKANGSGIYVKNRSLYAVMNDEVLGVFLFRDSTFEDNLKIKVMENFITQKEKAMIDKTIVTYLQKGSDMVVYGLPENLFEEDSWMNHFIGYGEIKGDAFEFKVDFDFKRDVTSYFPENKVNQQFNFDDIEGYLYMKTSVYATNASRLMDKITFFKMNDSLQKVFVPVLHNQLAKGFELYGHGMKKAELKLSDSADFNMRMLARDFFLPAFDFRLNCSDPQKIDTLLRALEKQGRISLQPNQWYLWQKDQYYKVYLALQNDWLNITTRPDASDKMPETGYSNVLYFNSDNFNEKLPTLQHRVIAGENKLFDYFLMYTTGVEKNILHTEGKLVIKKDGNGLVDGAKLMIRVPQDINNLKSFFSKQR